MAPAAFHAWLGHSFPMLDVVTLFVIATLLIDSVTDVDQLVIQGVGKPKMLAYNSVLGGIANIIFIAILLYPLGLVGVLLATLAGVTVRTAAFVYRFQKVMGLRLWRDLLSWLIPLVGGVVVAGGLSRLVLVLMPASWWAARAGAVVVVLALSLLYLVALIPALRLFRFLSRDDLVELASALPGRVSRFIGSHNNSLVIRLLAYRTNRTSAELVGS